MKPEWVNLSIKERADASAAEVEAVSAQIAQDLHKKTQILNTPHTGALVESLVSIAGQSPTFDDFKKNAGDHPYSEAAIATMYRDVVESKSQALRDHNKDAFFSDQTLNASATATVANMGLAAAGRVPEVGGNLANLSIEGVKAVQKAGLTQDDYVDYQSIQAKQTAYKDAADALQNPVNSRPETQKILQERMAKNSPESYSEGEKSLFKENIAVMPATNNMGMPNMAAPVLMSKMDKLQGITELTRGQEHVRELSKVVSKFVNTTSVDQMAAETKRNFESADGLIETAGVYLDAIVSNPTAVAHVAVQSTPEILMSLTGAGFVTSVASNFSEKTLEAREHYKNTFGVDASGDADNQLLAGAATAAFIDTGADRLIGGGGFKITEKLAEKGILQGAGIASKAARGTLGATQAVGSGFVLEGAAEGFGEAMTQAAGKQGYADIDWGQSFVEGALGSGSGAGIAGIGSALKGTKEAATETAQKMAGRIKAKETNDISGLVSNPLTADIAGAAKVLVSINANPDVDKETKDKATNDFDRAMNRAILVQAKATQLRNKAENGGGISREETDLLKMLDKQTAEFIKQKEIIKQAKDLRDGISIEESISVLTAPTINEDGTKPDNEISQMAISKVIQETMDAQTLFSAEDAQAILDNHGDQGTGNLTGEQMASLRAHIAVQHALGEAEALADNGVKTIESVRNDIYNGSPTQFGAKQYVAGILASLKYGDTTSAETLLEGLAQFTAGHQNKAGVLAAIAESFTPKSDGKVSPFTAQQQVAMATEKGIKLRETGFTSKFNADKMANAVGQEAKTLVTVLHAMGARMEAHTQSKTEPASVPVDTVAESQTEATVSTQPQAEPTEADSTNRASVSSGDTQPVSGTDTALNELLSLSEDEAIARINPSGVNTNTEDEVKLDEDTAPDYEQDSTQITEVDGVRIVETKSGDIHAVDKNNNVVSSIGLQGGVTVVQNRDTAPRGIGTQVIKEFIRRNPNAKAGSFTKGGEKAYRRAIRELQADKETQPSKQISPEFTVSKSKGYAERTKENAASADVTIAIAADFTTAGERLTAKAAGNKLFKANFGQLPETVAKNIVTFLNKKGAKTLNIAGNGIYTFVQKDPTVTQEAVDEYMYQVLKQVVESPDLKNKITNVRSGGQTGMDEAGAKAAMRLGIPTIVHTTPSWAMRDVNGKDSFNETEFKARFNLNNAEATPPSKREVISPERETEVETGTVSDEVLNEGVVAEQADGGIDTWDSLVEQREEMYQAEFNQISSDGVQVDENLTALNELAFADAPLSKYRISQIAKRIPKDVIAAFQQINKKITNSLKEPELLRNLRNDPAYPNLLVKFFRVKPSARTAPIVSIPGFISKLKDEAVRKNLLAQSGSNNKKSDEGKELVLTKLAAFTESFRAALDSSILFDQWTANNAINHFVLAEANPDGSMDIKSEVKDAMAVAIFNFIADSAAESLTKTDKQIGKVLGLDLQDGTRIHNEVRKTVGKSGVPYVDEVLNVGNEITKLLGLQLNPEAGKDLHHTFQTELAISLGNAAVNAMFNMTDTTGNPVMKAVDISTYDMNIAYELLHNQVSLETAKSLVGAAGYKGQFKEATRTIQVAFTEDVKTGVRKPNDYIQGEVIGPVQAAGSFLQEVFGTLKATKFPTFAPVVITEETDVKLKRTEQKAATEAREAQNKLNSTPNYLKNWFVRLSGSMSAQRFAEMIGLDTDIDSHTHVDNRESANSVNQLKLTEVERMYTFHEQYQNSKNFVELGYKTPFYLEHEQNRTARAQIKQNVMSDQSNKDTRHAMYKGDWKQTYSVNPAAGDLVSHQNLLAWELAVGQALGIAIDKQFPEDSQRQLAALMEDEVLMAAVEAASYIDEESEISEETLSTFENALAVHGKSTATLDGIFALGAMVRARRENKLYFESDIGIEYDGVTDGPMRVLLQYAKVDETWAAQLAAGGIYVNRQDGLSDIVTGVMQGILDRYQYAIVTAEGLWNDPEKKTSTFKVGNEKVSLILQHTDKYTGKVIDQKSLLNRLFGPMVNRQDDGTFSISKIMRNIAKVIVTPMGYQAAPQSSQNAFGNTIHERVTTMFENMHKIQIGDINPDSKKGREIIAEAATLNEVFKQLAPGFIVPVRDDKGNIQWLKSKVNIDTKFPFPAWVDNGKGKGKPGHYFMTVPDYLGKTYGKVLTDAVEEISESSKELRADTVNVTNMSVAMFEAARDHLVTEALASKQGAKGAAAVLTIAEAEAIQEKLKAIHPELASALTSELGEGVSILKTKGTALQERKVQTKLKPTKFNTITHSEVATPTSNIKSPGVSAVPVQILADDASNLIRGTLRSTDQTVLHDASISSPVHAVANNAHWNTVMYENAATHSVPVATANTASRILEGTREILGDGFVLPESLVKKYNLKDFYEKATGIHYPATALQIEAIIASYSIAADVQFQARKEALTNGIVTFNHYAAHGADVTFENGVKRDLASMSKEELASELPKAIADLATEINNNSVPENESEVLPANWYAPLFKVLDDNLEPLTVAQAMATIDVKKLSPNLKAAEIVLKKLSMLIDPDTRIIMYDPAQTYTGDLAWLNTAESVRAKATNSVGLHVPRDNKETGGVNKPVIILMKSTNTNETGISQETLMHELLHAALDGYIGDKSSQFYKDITALMEAVRTQLGDAAIDQPGLTNVREFVAYGLSNAAFQSVLKNTAVSAKFIGSQIAPHVGGAWARFKNAVINAVFGTEVKNKDINNAMSALMEVVAVVGQQNVVIKSTPKPSAEIGQQQTNHGHRHDISRTNSMELFDRMKHMGHTKASVAHRNTLAGVLESIVNVAMTPLQVIIKGNQIGESFGDLTATDRLEIYSATVKDATVQGLPNQIGFNKSVQESYVYGLMQAVLDEGLTATTGYSNAANKLFNAAKDKLTYLDFMEDPASQDPAEIEFAKRRYDSVFDVSSHAANTYSDTSSGLTFDMHHSNYLRDFLSLAATNEKFGQALSTVSVPESKKAETVLDKIIGLITDVFNFILNKTTGVNTKENLKVNLDRLTARLLTKHLEEQSKVEKLLDQGLHYTSVGVGYVAEVLKQGIAKAAGTAYVRNHSSSTVRVVGDIARLVGTDRSEYLFKSMDDMFSQVSAGKQAFAGELMTEVKGTTRDTTKVHTLLRVANHVLDRGRKEVIETTKRMLVRSFHRDLTAQEKVGLTKFLLRTDAVSLNALGYTQGQLADLIDRPTYRAQEIAVLEGKISGFVLDAKLRDYYLNQAEELGAMMVNGTSTNPHAVANAHLIATVAGMTTLARPDDSTIAAVLPLIDGLATLHAIHRTAAKGKYTGVANLIREEYTRNDDNGDRDNNGITFMLRTHMQVQEKALKENFAGNPVLMRKGHMPSITNSYIDVQVAESSDKADMAKRGYTEVYALENDANHHMAPKRSMFLSKAGGLATFQRMALSTTQNKTKGFKITDPGDIAILAATAIQQEARLTNGRVSPLYSRNPVHAQATFNEDGKVVGYRYVITEATKDNLLERDDNFAEVLAKHAGNVYDKAVSKPHNEMVIKALKEQYDIDMAAGKGHKYIRLSLKSDDPELVELYKLLPDATRDHIKKVFGTDSIPVRAEFLRVVFGFRNVAITDLWQAETENGFFGNLVKGTFDALPGGSGVVVASHFERGLKDIVRVAKTNLVVRSGVITAANFVSNTYDLVINGLSVREAASWQADGYKYGIQYIKLSSRVSEINMLLEADHNPSHRKKLESEKAQLMNLQATNPAAKLIEAGLLQTIVLEVNQDIDPYSMTAKWAKALEDRTSKLPQGVQDVGKFVLMTRDSQSFELMNRLVQFGDFAARYALYKKLTTQKYNQVSHVDAIQKVITHFVNYDLPTHRMIQYGNDMGFVWFSRYWIRIQKVILTNFAENPGRVLTGLMMQGLLGVDVSDTHDSSVISTGVFHPFGGFDRVASGLLTNPVLLQ